ncbi:hypothetical protein GLS40_11850 [Pseudooceanicola sp. 216_PA32_1]|uniref:Uncharacterized protein n=1 Tax=Pseudooceanicola pacificus TaxID=2676438 RepID=A0A844WBW2_9RHOB|nr:hypothetical protein [Pseudooceanicola pacificus]MWB78723.1 hypothetical protein [Pseudooceanicola pacificus]
MGDPLAAKLFAKAEAMAKLGVMEPEDLAELAAFPASPAVAKITGQRMSAIGGLPAI